MQKNKQEVKHVVFIVKIDDKISMAAFSSAVIVNFLPWTPVHSDENQQEQGSRAKHSRVTRTSEPKCICFCLR